MLSPYRTNQPLKLQSNKDHQRWFSYSVTVTSAAQQLLTWSVIFTNLCLTALIPKVLRLLLLATNMLLVSDKKHLQLAPDTGSSPKHHPLSLRNCHTSMQQTEQVKRQLKNKEQSQQTTQPLSTYIVKSPYLSTSVSYEHVESNAAFKCGQKYQNHKHRS